jgi:hypothetical protein
MDAVLGTVAAGMAAAALRAAAADTHCVSPSSPFPSWPYTDWFTAAHDIPTALYAASNGDVILVTNGTYSLSAEMVVSGRFTLKSVLGPTVTTIDRGDPTNHRLFTVYHPAAVIDGFTLSGGYAEGNGGAVNLEGGGTVQNCIVTWNTANGDGGGVAIATNGGTVRNCVFESNLAYGAGGGVAAAGASAVRNCHFALNTSGSGYGGGVHSAGRATVENCTIIGNFGRQGALYVAGTNGVIRNCIVYANSFTNWGPATAGPFEHSCLFPAAAGPGNFTNNPKVFQTTVAVGWDFHLQPGSPCHDAGTNQPGMSVATDLDGYPRITGASVDIGCYEYAPFHYFAPGGTNAWPYTSWGGAATNIYAAVSAARRGESVVVTNGTHSFTGAVTILTPVRLCGADGAPPAVIDGGFARRCVELLHSNAVVDGLTLLRGSGVTGGGVYAEGGSVLNCTITNCAAEWDGGGVYFFRGGLLSNSVVRWNQATNTGAGVYCRLGGTLRDSVIRDNGRRGLSAGGGVYCHLAGLVSNCTVTANWARRGAGVYLERGGAIDACRVTNNVVQQDGAVFLEEGGTVLGSLVAGNTGSGVLCLRGGALSNCTVAANVGGGAMGGGLILSQGGEANGTTISGNRAGQGAGVFVDGSGTLRDCTIVSNIADSTCGGVYLLSGGEVLNTTIRDNQAAGVGGVWCDGGGLLRNCLVVSNRASDVVGGVAAGAGSTVGNCTIIGNTALSAIGGLDAVNGAVIENTLVYNNVAPANANWYAAGTGAVFLFCCSVPVPAGTGNFSDDPRLLPAPRPPGRVGAGSSCVDAGTNRPWMTGATDFRGAARLGGGRVDVGAFESAPRYVTVAGAHVAPFLTWANAATGVEAAVAAAWDGDTVFVSGGTYRVSAPLAVTASVALASTEGPAATVLTRGAAPVRILSLTGPYASLQGFTVTNGQCSEAGGGIYLASGGEVRNCRVYGNTAGTYGGGIFAAAAGGTIRDCLLAGNAALTNDGGGAYLSPGACLRNCLVAGNRGYNGGGVFLYLDALVESCTVASNAAYSGGGVHCYPSNGIVRNSVVYLNSATVGSNWTVNATATFQSSCALPVRTGCLAANPLFSDPVRRDFRIAAASPCRNAASNLVWMTGATDLEGADRKTEGAADIGAYEVTPTHYASPAGTGAWPHVSWPAAAGALQDAVDAAVNGDTVLAAAGVYTVTSQVSLTKGVLLLGPDGRAATTIRHTGSRPDRVLYLSGSNAVAQGFTITNGYTPSVGGGVFCASGATLRDCAVNGNTAGTYGGGVYLATDGGTVERCVLRGNTCLTNDGGGVYGSPGSVVRQCLIVSNRAANGGGAFVYLGGLVESCTIVSNRGVSGGGVHFFPSDGTLRNSIVWGNSASSGGDQWTVNGAALFDHVCTLPAKGGAVGSITNDPLFRGAGQEDYRLAAGSPCTDAGVWAAWMAGAGDLAGTPRVLGSAVDMGAYESHGLHFVSLTGGHAPPFATWAGAATNIADAIGQAEPGDTVQVTGGVYAVGAEIAVPGGVTLRSTGGASATVVRRRGATPYRVFAVGPGRAVLDGFTVTNGYSADAGGGVYCAASGLVQNCVIAGNTAATYGGGVFAVGPGALIRSCTLAGNLAAANDGGGIYLSPGTALQSSLVISNHAYNGGGVFAYLSATVDACTVVGNIAVSGGGVHCFPNSALIRNSILYYNQDDEGTPNWHLNDDATFEYTCAWPLPPGTGNTGTRPYFVSPDRGNVHLKARSPCRDSGTNAAWMGDGPDLLGGPRIRNGRVDMGACEALPAGLDSDGDGMADWWELAYTGSTTGLAANADSDGDGFPNDAEYQADTDPFDPESRLAMLSILCNGTRHDLQWKGGTDVTQYVERASALTGTGSVWLAIGTNPAPTASPGKYRDAGPAPRAFYRLRAGR